MKKKLTLKTETLRNLSTKSLKEVQGAADSGSFTETGTGLCVTNAQYSCASMTAAC